jgi:hypothetical protein
MQFKYMCLKSCLGNTDNSVQAGEVSLNFEECTAPLGRCAMMKSLIGAGSEYTKYVYLCHFPPPPLPHAAGFKTTHSYWPGILHSVEK